jgi:sugar lactone lactonase YvrE
MLHDEEPHMKLISHLLRTALLALLASTPAMAAPQYTVVADHLVSPRGLAFTPNGRLYVAQAGNGGMSGKITQITKPASEDPIIRDVVTGLISLGDEGEFIGVSGLSANGAGTLYAIMSLSNAGAVPHSRLGYLMQVNPAGRTRSIANVGDFDYAWTGDHASLVPFGDFPDANPYGVLAQGDQLYVADAGANTLDVVHPDGTIAILAFFPNNALADGTPTCIAKGPDGALYVGTLALVDSVVSGPSATVYRVDPHAARPGDLATILSLATPWATGLWPVNGCAFGPDGSFYASQLITASDFSGGDVVKIPFATPAVHISLTGNTLAFPAGVAVGPDRRVYVSNGGAFLPEGQVVRLAQH